MKNTALLLSLVLFAACASPTAIKTQHFRCEPGDPLSVAAGYDPGTQAGDLGEREFLVEVSNNSHQEVTVTSVRVEPSDRNRGLASVYEKTDVTLAGGEDHLFHLRAPSAFGSGSQSMLGPSGVVEFQVTVVLSNGDAYRCPFRAEVR